MLALQTCANHFPVIATSTLLNFTQMLLASSFTTIVSFTESFTTFVNHHLCLSLPMSITTIVLHHLCLSPPLSSPSLSITTFVYHHLSHSSPLSSSPLSTQIPFKAHHHQHLLTSVYLEMFATARPLNLARFPRLV